MHMSQRPIIESIESVNQANQSDALDQLSTFARRQSARIAIKAKGTFLFFSIAEIAAIEAKGNYVVLHHTASSYSLRESISMMEHRFSPYGFVRIHRSALVNAALVEEVQPCSTGEYVLRVRGGREYTVTRTYKHNLHRLAACWLGGDGFYADKTPVNLTETSIDQPGNIAPTLRNGAP
jgi:DNA-binding LytR/AlgR family response regulator